MAAADAGASTVFIVRPASRSAESPWWPGGPRDPIPALVVGHSDGQRLIEAATSGDAWLRLRLETSTPYLYDVMHVEHDQVPEDIVHRVTGSNSARVDVVAELPNARQDVETTADDAAYRLELTTARESEEWIWGTRTETAWEFRSARPADSEPTLLPLLQVDYDAPVDLHGQVSGRRQHLLGLELRHQDGLPAPTAGTVRVEVSFDEGETWRQVTVRGAGSSYGAFVPPGQGTVSLRVHAEDGAGNSVEQTIIRAYGLT